MSIRARGWEATRRRILARDDRVCGICHLPGATSVDHIVARALGGGHDDLNLRAAHSRCNSRLGGRLNARRDTLPHARPSRWQG